MAGDVLDNALKQHPKFNTHAKTFVLFGGVGLLSLLISIALMATAYFADFGSIVTNSLYFIGFVGLGLTYSMVTGALEHYSMAKRISRQIQNEILASARSGSTQ